VCTKFINTISMPNGPPSCVKKVSFANKFDGGPGSQKSYPLTTPQNRSRATTLILRRSLENVPVVDWRENFAVVGARIDVAAGVNSLSQPRRIQ
jgi:hypothetical protein